MAYPKIVLLIHKMNVYFNYYSNKQIKIRLFAAENIH